MAKRSQDQSSTTTSSQTPTLPTELPTELPKTERDAVSVSSGNPENTNETKPVTTAVVPHRNSVVTPPMSFQGMELSGAADQSEYDAAMAEIDAAQQSNIGMGEIQISRIAIGQPGTPEVAQKQEGWDSGMLFDNISREILSIKGKYPWLLAKGVAAADLKLQYYMPFVPVFKLPTEYVMWPSKKEREDGMKNFHWKSLDMKEPRVRAGLWPPKGTQVFVKGEPPRVTEHINWLGIVLDAELKRKSGFIIATFSRTSFKTGGKLTTNVAHARQMQRLPAWGRIQYLFTGTPQTNDQGTFYVLQVAIGPKLEETPDKLSIGRDAMALARQFANPENGRTLQEMYINAAAFTGEEDHGEVGEGVAQEDDGDPTF